MNKKPKGKKFMTDIAHISVKNRIKHREAWEKTREIIKQDFEPVVFKEAIINIFES